MLPLYTYILFCFVKLFLFINPLIFIFYLLFLLFNAFIFKLVLFIFPYFYNNFPLYCISLHVSSFVFATLVFNVYFHLWIYWFDCSLLFYFLSSFFFSSSL